MKKGVLLLSLVGLGTFLYWYGKRPRKTLDIEERRESPKFDARDLVPQLEQELDLIPAEALDTAIPQRDPLDGDLVQQVSSWLLRQPKYMTPGMPKPSIEGASWVEETMVVQNSDGSSFQITRGKDRAVNLISYLDGPFVLFVHSTGEINPYF